MDRKSKKRSNSRASRPKKRRFHGNRFTAKQETTLTSVSAAKLSKSDDEAMIRPGKKSDCEAIRALIQELADFEKMPNGPKVSHKDLERDGFDTQPPLFMSFVATIQEKVIGYAICYYTFSTWDGKSLFLEDLCVSAEFRNKHIGSQLFNSVAQFAVKNNCGRMDFSVLNWNPAEEFYKRKGAIDLTKSEGWHAYRLNREALNKLCETSKN